MAKIVLAPELKEDFERIFEFVAKYDSTSAISRVDSIIAAIDILKTSPEIGRPAARGKRELIIGSGAKGYVALYGYAKELDIVFILAIRAQREAGYARE